MQWKFQKHAKCDISCQTLVPHLKANQIKSNQREIKKTVLRSRDSLYPVLIESSSNVQSTENRRKKCHRSWLPLRQAVILISNVRTSASKKIYRKALIRTLDGHDYCVQKNEGKILWFSADCVHGFSSYLKFVEKIQNISIPGRSRGLCQKTEKSHSSAGAFWLLFCQHFSA